MEKPKKEKVANIEATKTILVELALEYFKKQKLIIQSQRYAFSGLEFVRDPNGKNTSNQKYYVERLLFEEDYAKIGNVNYYQQFVENLLSKYDTQPLGLWLLRKKEPGFKSYEFDKYKSFALRVSAVNEALYFNYINRGAFLYNNLGEMEQYIKTLNQQNYKEALMDTLLEYKGYQKQTDINKQTILFNLVDKHIRNKKKYAQSFPDIEIISEENKEELNFVSESKKEDIIFIHLDVQKLNTYYLKDDISIHIVCSALNNALNKLNNKLNVRKAQIEENTNKTSPGSLKMWQLSFIGTDLSEEKINIFLNKTLRKVAQLSEWKNSANLEEIVSDIVKETEAEYLTRHLNNQSNNTNKAKLRKI